MNRESRLKIACPACGQKLDVTGYAAFEEVGCPACGCSILVPRLFGNFLLEEIIGRGGMAVVYRALDLTLHRDVAIKVLNEDIAAEHHAAERFLQEGRAAAAVNHINVVPIYSSGQAEGLPYLVMQYLEGLSLDRQIERAEGPVSLDFCLRIGTEASRGLEAALHQGIIHHDIKPANILLDEDGVAKVGDFGLAQLLHEEGGGGGEGEHWVTPYYVSPEKVETGTEDYRGDIYSLGATLYHLLSGQAPFRGGSERAVMEARLQVDPRPLQQLRPEVPPAVTRMIHAMLSRDCSQRPQGYGVITSCLEETLHGMCAHPGLASGGLRPAARTSGAAFPRLLLRDSADVRERRARVRAAPYGKGAGKPRALLDGLLLACTVAIVAFLALDRFSPDAAEEAVERGVPAADRPAAGRPRPVDFNFRALRPEIEDYLDTLPPDEQPREVARLELLIGTRSHLAAELTRLGYSMPASGLLLRDGGHQGGRIRRIDAEGVQVSQPDGGGERLLSWRELSENQILAFYDFLIQEGARSPLPADPASYAAEQSLRAAVFSDWYNRPGRVSSYLGQALEMDPELRAKAARLFPGQVSAE